MAELQAAQKPSSPRDFGLKRVLHAQGTAGRGDRSVCGVPLMPSGIACGATAAAGWGKREGGSGAQSRLWRFQQQGRAICQIRYASAPSTLGEHLRRGANGVAAAVQCAEQLVALSAGLPGVSHLPPSSTTPLVHMRDSLQLHDTGVQFLTAARYRCSTRAEPPPAVCAGGPAGRPQPGPHAVLHRGPRAH